MVLFWQIWVDSFSSVYVSKCTERLKVKKTLVIYICKPCYRSRWCNKTARAERKNLTAVIPKGAVAPTTTATFMSRVAEICIFPYGVYMCSCVCSCVCLCASSSWWLVTCVACSDTPANPPALPSYPPGNSETHTERLLRFKHRLQ